jgi:hypothetical protein
VDKDGSRSASLFLQHADGFGVHGILLLGFIHGRVAGRIYDDVGV